MADKIEIEQIKNMFPLLSQEDYKCLYDEVQEKLATLQRSINQDQDEVALSQITRHQSSALPGKEFICGALFGLSIDPHLRERYRSLLLQLSLPPTNE